MSLVVEGVTKVYPGGVTALDAVDLSLHRGESYGLVGESGSGKTTLTRCILALEPVTAGRILYEGEDLARLSSAALRRMRARLQVVFQDPYASLNPRMTARAIVTEPMVIHRATLGLDRRRRRDRAVEILGLVGLGAQHLERYPHEFSGGQRQRIGIARALAVGPDCLLLDEPTSALDVSVQAQILNLLDDLQRRLRLTYLFISHDLGVIRCSTDRVSVIHRGRIVESGVTETVFARPASDYARALLAAMPEPDPDRSPFARPLPDG